MRFALALIGFAVVLTACTIAVGHMLARASAAYPKDSRDQSGGFVAW